jgi:hypothetical protein
MRIVGSAYKDDLQARIVGRGIIRRVVAKLLLVITMLFDKVSSRNVENALMIEALGSKHLLSRVAIL